MRINPFVFAGIVLVVFLGVIFGFRSAGVWSISGKSDSRGQAVQPASSDVSSIKGWMTLEQITTAYQVSLEEIIQAFDLPADTSLDTAVRELESDTFSVADLRNWLQARSPSPDSTATPVPSATPTPPPDSVQPIPEDATVTGKTTFQDLLDWGMTQETIEMTIGSTMPDPDLLIRDYLSTQGLQFSAIKITLQVELDKLK